MNTNVYRLCKVTWILFRAILQIYSLPKKDMKRKNHDPFRGSCRGGQIRGWRKSAIQAEPFVYSFIFQSYGPKEHTDSVRLTQTNKMNGTGQTNNQMKQTKHGRTKVVD